MSTNMNISTPEGMRNAIEWQRKLFSIIREGGRWVVPRSGSVFEIIHSRQTVRLCVAWLPDPDIIKVIKAMGWKVLDRDGMEI